MDAVQPQVGLDRDGDAVIAWTRSSDMASHRIQARVRSPDGAVTPIETLSAVGGAGAQVAVAPDGDALIVWQKLYGGNVGIQARFRSANGDLSAIEQVSGSGFVQSPKVGVARDGDAVVVWRQVGYPTSGIQARSRSADGVWSPIENLSSPHRDADFPQVAVAPDGDGLFVWQRGGPGARIQARARSKTGVLGPLQTISPVSIDEASPQVSITPDGTAVLAWRDVVDGDVRIRARLRFATGALSRTRSISAAGQDARNPQVAIPPNGDAVFAWARHDGRHWRVQGRMRSADGVFSPTINLSTPVKDADCPDVAIDREGHGLVAWNQDGRNWFSIWE